MDNRTNEHSFLVHHSLQGSQLASKISVKSADRIGQLVYIEAYLATPEFGRRNRGIFCQFRRKMTQGTTTTFTAFASRDFPKNKHRIFSFGSRGEFDFSGGGEQNLAPDPIGNIGLFI